MDARRVAHYIRAEAMNLLLILSAILSTLTGVVTGARAPDLRVQACATAARETMLAAVATLPVRAGHRHLLGTIGLRPGFALLRATRALPLAAPRLYLDRPRA